MEIITIVVNPDTGAMTVIDGQVKGSRQWFSADGLIICKKGSSIKMHDRFCNLACNEAIARRIPAKSLRRIEK